MPDVLTAIIPFLNEGAEVFNTVESIRNTSENVDIILINDASTDGYDYRAVAERFGAVYVEHSERKGVAASRDEGVEMCETEYFILLDAHMRFYQNDWVDRIKQAVDRDSRALYCCQTVILAKNDDGEVSVKECNPPYGAYINFSTPEVLNPSWNHFVSQADQDVVDIPCVLGASYVCCKAYWQKLKGLEGLRSYGLDEPLISLKVWLEGGRCRLVRNVKVGHIYRPQLPYEVKSFDYVFNQLYIAELLFDSSLKYQVFSCVQSHYPNHFDQALQEIDRSANKIEEQKSYFKSIFSRPKEEVIRLNNLCRRYSKYMFFSYHTLRDADTPDQKKGYLYRSLCWYFLAQKSRLREPGLMQGKVGLAVALSLSKEEKLLQTVENLLDETYESVDTGTSLDFSKGLIGIAWAMDHLNRRSIVALDLSDFLEDIDEQVVMAFHRAPLQSFRADVFLSPGLYYLMRRHGDSKLKSEGFFDQLTDYTLKLLEAKIEAVEKGVQLYEPYFICSLLFFIEQLSDDVNLRSKLLPVFEAATRYLQVLLPVTSNALDGYIITRMMARLVTAGYVFPEWNQQVRMEDVVREVENLRAIGLFKTASKIAVCNLVWGDVVAKEISTPIISLVVETIAHREEWEKAFCHFDHENIGLEGMAGLALLFGQSYK